MSQTFFLDPLDVLLFRDGRPRVTGDSHVMKGAFPPPPSALYGAFRSALLARAGARFSPADAEAPFRGLPDDVARAVGDPRAPGTLTLERVHLARRDGATTPLFPAPLDLVRPKDEARKAERLRLVPVDDGNVRTSLPAGLRPLGVPGETAFVEPLRGWLDADAFTAYLRGDVAGLRLHAEAEEAAPYATEPRTSVMLNDTRGTAADGMLYTTDFTRLRPGYGLAVRVAGAPGLGERGLLRLGAEQRPVAYEATSLLEPDYEAVRPALEGRFRLVLASPAPFASGWRPDFVEDDLTGTFSGCRVRLVGAAVGRYEHVGGWDLVARRPKPAQRAAPAGSVYFFERLDGDPAALAAAHGRSLFPSGDGRARCGLGLAYIGAY